MATSCTHCHAISLGSLWRNKTKVPLHLTVGLVSDSVIKRGHPLGNKFDGQIIYYLYYITWFPRGLCARLKFYTTREPLKKCYAVGVFVVEERKFKTEISRSTSFQQCIQYDVIKVHFERRNSLFGEFVF